MSAMILLASSIRVCMVEGRGDGKKEGWTEGSR